MFKKIFSLTLALVFCATCFVGCSGKKDPNATKDPTDAPSNDSTAEPVPTAVKVVYAANSNFRKAAIKLQDKILSLKGSSLENMSFCVIGTDDKIADDQTVQILLGETNREISANAKAELKSYLDYSVLYDGNKIAIYAYDEAKMLEAAEYVISKISLSNDQTQLIYSGEQKVVKFFTDYELPNATIGSVAISNYSIVYSAQATNVEKDFAKA